MNKNKEIIVLDPKRSNAINIGMTKLPPPRSIKTAILKMDATIMNREGIEKLLTMLPTEEERSKIQEAQAANPDLPLGSAEQFLLTLASISELPARLKLWAFKLDFENSEREIAEPLMDLKQGIELLRANKTFRGILSTLLSIGNFLNGNEVKGFQIDYLAKVPEVKDTVHKHSLLHHLCHIVMEKFPDATDLYSEVRNRIEPSIILHLFLPLLDWRDHASVQNRLRRARPQHPETRVRLQSLLGPLETHRQARRLHDDESQDVRFSERLRREDHPRRHHPSEGHEQVFVTMTRSSLDTDVVFLQIS
jgi:hypothetical protein